MNKNIQAFVYSWPVVRRGHFSCQRGKTLQGTFLGGNYRWVSFLGEKFLRRVGGEGRNTIFMGRTLGGGGGG